MRIATIYHVPYEKLGYIEDWIISKGHAITEYELYISQVLPKTDDFDLLILMGGSMSVNDENNYPWLVPEKELIRQVVRSGKSILGICLGAQLIASSLGSRVYRGEHKEIGWFPVRFNQHKKLTGWFHQIPLQTTVFHWHGDTFELPPGAIRLAESELTKNQGFLFKENVLAIQFHIEMKPENISLMINNCGNELVQGPYINSGEKITGGVIQLPENHKLLAGFLNHFEKLTK